MKLIKEMKHRSFSVIANCEHSEAGSKEKEMEDEACRTKNRAMNGVSNKS
jgi:hypothetical protein